MRQSILTVITMIIMVAFATIANATEVFGFKRNMTIDEVRALTNDMQRFDNSTYIYAATLKKKHPDITLILFGFNEYDKLRKITFVTKSGTMNQSSSRVIEFTRAISKKYGRNFKTIPEDFSEVDDYTVLHLKNGKPFVIAWANFKEEYNDLEAIYIKVEATDDLETYVTVSYEFDGWSEDVRKREVEQNSGF